MTRKELETTRVSLPLQLLVLTIVFVLVAESFVFVLSIGKYRIDWLRDRVDAAQIAVLAQEAAPEGMIDDGLVRELLNNAEVYAVSLRRDDMRQLVLMPDERPPLVPGVVNLDDFNPIFETVRALITFFAHDDRMLIVMGTPRLSAGEKIEATVPLGPLKEEMWTYAGNILVLSLGIAIFTAGSVYFALTIALVRPMTRLTANMRRFQRHPEDETRIMRPTGRNDEIGDAEIVLADMQAELHAALRRKERLAALGAGVSKISHDLRNVLASAQLISDRLQASDDPLVSKLAPRLLKSLDRAVVLCRDTLAYGRVGDAPLSLERFPLRPLVADAGLDAAPEDGPVRTEIDIDESFAIRADREQLFRVLLNLMRNAAQILRIQEEGERVVRVSVSREAGRVLIDIADTGPGVPDAARENLFKPFAGSTTKGGSGLGLAIAHELVRAHKGDLHLHRTGPEGAVFRISLPD
ncbi:MAG: HAMP domain-containing sensor histidine kinase [Pseudomonadota bacterium]